MTGERRFARLRNDVRAGYSTIPGDGMCLSAYLVLRSATSPRQVVLGKVNPSGPWWEVAAIDEERLRSLGERWVLPATHLLLFEGPQEAARRIATEMLGRPTLNVGLPRVFSESYGRGEAGVDPHWDLQFVFSAPWTGPPPEEAKGALWKELRFVDVEKTPASSFGRGHGDVLALAGLAPILEGEA